MSDAIEKKVYCDILQNGIDFLWHSLVPPSVSSHYQAENYGVDVEPVLLKYRLLHLAAAIELILKARLGKEHWALIFSKVDQASISALKTGAFRSVNFNACVKRLGGISELSFPSPTLEIFKTVREQRNRVMHYRHEKDDDSYIRDLTALCINEVVDLLDAWFCAEDYLPEGRETLKNLRPLLAQYSKIREERLKALENKIKNLANQNQIGKCPICGEETLELACINNCLFCGWKEEANVVASMEVQRLEQEREYRKIQLSLFEMPPVPYAMVKKCKKCGDEALVEISSDEARKEIISLKCYSCGYSGSVDETT